MKPALTEEEWEHQEFAIGEMGEDTLFGFRDPDTGILSLSWNGDPMRGVKNTAPLAALALWGQPFGFTREDLAWLRRMEFTTSDRSEAETHNAWGKSFLQRLESLLPPAT